MLKKHITKWAIDRKHKQPDMLVALRLAFQRQAQGKKTVFLIRGRLVTFDDVKQYFRRKGVHDLQSIITDAEIATATTQIRCRTPDPDTTAGDRAIHDPEALIDATDLDLYHGINVGHNGVESPIMALPDPNHVDPMMPVTVTLSQLEQLVHLGCAYYDSIFENVSWRSMEKTFDLGSLEIFYHNMIDGQILLERHRVAEAFKYFGRAFDLIHHLLNSQVLLFLPYLHHMMLLSRRIRRHEVFSLLLDFICQMSETCYPILPIKHSLALLHNMSAEDRAESSERALRSILDRVQVEFQADVPDELELRSDTVCSLARQPQTDFPVQHNLDNYKLTSIAVWKLVREAETFKLVSRPKQACLLNTTDVSTKRLYLGNLPRSATRADVETHFSSHGTGKITEIKLMNGFGFIEYEDSFDTPDIVPAFHGSGNRLTIQYARGSSNCDALTNRDSVRLLGKKRCRRRHVIENNVG